MIRGRVPSFELNDSRFLSPKGKDSHIHLFVRSFVRSFLPSSRWMDLRTYLWVVVEPILKVLDAERRVDHDRDDDEVEHQSELRRRPRNRGDNHPQYGAVVHNVHELFVYRQTDGRRRKRRQEVRYLSQAFQQSRYCFCERRRRRWLVD